jgi:hypothetical protein
MTGVEFLVAVACPVCRSPQRCPCTGPGGGSARRVPHWRRAVLAVARVLIGVSVRGSDPVLTAELYCDLDPRGWGPQLADPGVRKPELDDLGELSAYQAAGYLQHLIGQVLDAADYRTLSLEEISEQCESMRRALSQARDSAQLLQDGLTRPEDAQRPEFGRPSPDEAQVWHELVQLAQIRDRMEQRDQAAASRWPGTPAGDWLVGGLLGNGVFHARSTSGVTVHGWAETPEAIADVLRVWSVPAGAPVTISWAVPPERPGRRLPFGGWAPGHPANVDGLGYFHDRPDVHRAWQAQLPEAVPAFAAAIDCLRQSWRAGDDLKARLSQAAERLNDHEPQAPSLGSIIRGGDDRNHPAAAITQTTEWMDPALIAWSGRMTWSGFGSHRPDQPENFTRALLACTDPAETAAKSWGLPAEPVRLHRVPGPAGPLYELGDNGMHRIHTARMLGFPLLWAEVTQYALPLKITWWDLADGEALTPELKNSILVTWQGLLGHGLLTGDLDHREAVLRPAWIAAPWLLTRAQHAVRWACNYERAYPGALHRLGIPATAWQSPADWQAWLGQAP